MKIKTFEHKENTTCPKKNSFPSLFFSDLALNKLINKLANESSLIVANPYHFGMFNTKLKSVFVSKCDCSKLLKVKDDYTYNNVIAVGGCSALDFGRSLATKSKELVVIPSILSTSCISVGHSVEYYFGQHRYVRTTIPKKVIICIPLLRSSSLADLNKWSSSGYGDLFANISASIDYCWKRGSLKLDNIRNKATIAFSALESLIDQSSLKSPIDLNKLAKYLHMASIEVLKRGDSALSAAGEHDLYFVLSAKPGYDRKIQTHGRLVTIGTLISVWCLQEISGEGHVFKDLVTACRRVGLPVNFRDFAKFGVQRKHILEGLDIILGTNSFLSNRYREFGRQLVDEVLKDF